jgi:hypothetical protein
MCNTFVIHKKTFEKLMSWLLQYYRDDINVNRHPHIGNAGQIPEALIGMFLSLEVLEGAEYYKFNVEHIWPLYKNKSNSTNTTNMIRYLAGGKLGDFIHQLSIINENYLKTGKKGTLYIRDLESAGNKFGLGFERAYNDTKTLIKSQPYIHEYKIYNGEPYDINLSSWRNNDLLYKTNWYNLFKAEYNVEWGTHPWLYTSVINPEFTQTILFNCVMTRFPENIDFTRLFNEYGKDNVIFITENINEYREFIDKTGIEIQVYVASSIEDFIIAVNSCKLFIATQSSPLTYAYGLHKKNISLIVKDSGDGIFVNGLEHILPGTNIITENLTI